MDARRAGSRDVADVGDGVAVAVEVAARPHDRVREGALVEDVERRDEGVAHDALPLAALDELGNVPGVRLAARAAAHAEEPEVARVAVVRVAEVGVDVARAELARRLAHLLFISSREYRRWLDSLSQAWYDHLVNHRLNPTPDDASQAKRLEEQAQEMNADMLQVWREVLTFLCSGPIQDATEVNRCAAEWGLRIHARAREKSALISQIGPSRTLQTT